ncbi:MAG: family 16 glycoside hydrolase [Ferruginibacter sp.]
MKKTSLLVYFLLPGMLASVFAQQLEVIPDLSKVKESGTWAIYNREATYDGEVHINGKPGDGLLRLTGSNFMNGQIELDIKGKDEQGMSFVGLAFHGLNDSTYDAIYFRPFNFKSPQRDGHSVQYIAHPLHTWNKLRDEHPGVYENKVSPVPEPSGWFHASIVVKYPVVEVFINNSNKPSLTINQLSNQKAGWVGFWVGNNSEGYFKNLKIITKNN